MIYSKHSLYTVLCIGRWPTGVWNDLHSLGQNDL